MILPMTGRAEIGSGAVQPGSTALLIDVVTLAKLLDRSPTSVRRDDKAGQIPRPVSLGGAKKWRLAEVVAWVEAGCPKRRIWDLTFKPAGLRKAS
jgi:predicted DNA-binding transcriptional regulator AlpA